MGAAKSQILLVEDEPDTAQLISVHLLRAGYDVLVVGSSEAALECLERRSFHLFIFDWMLPGMSGLDLVRELRGREGWVAEVPILMISARATGIDAVLALEVGASDFMAKPFDPAVLVARAGAAIRRARFARGEAKPAVLAAHPDPWKIGELDADFEAPRVNVEGRTLDLSRSELAVLKALMSNRGRVLSRKVLIDLAIGPGAAVTPRAIDTHVFTLRQKLGKLGGLIVTVRGTGYRID